jgi:hypothetical protein
MTNSEKIDSGKNQPMHVTLAVLALPLILSGCATEAEFLAQNAPSALNTALTRGRFELNCPQATGAVLSQKVTYINGMGIGMGGGGYEWTEYTVGVKGCGKQAVYETMCRDQDNCNAFANTGRVLEGGQ